MNKIVVPIIFLVVASIAGVIFSVKGIRREPVELKPVEIREYEGSPLSSIKDFRENSIKGPQYVDIGSYKLKVAGLVKREKTFKYDEVIKRFKNYKKVLTLYCVEGWAVNILWEGVLVRDIISQAGVKDNAKTVIFHAVDGYTTSFPIGYIMDNDILLAYKMNDVILPPERGFPFQLVAEDKWGYKWIKWVKEIELSDNVNYKGYWESRGFSNEGDLDKSFLENP